MEFKTFTKENFQKGDIIGSKYGSDRKIKKIYTDKSNCCDQATLVDTKCVHSGSEFKGEYVFGSSFKNFEHYGILQPEELIKRNQERIDNLLN